MESDDIKYLISLLNEKKDKIRYTAFLVLQSRSKLYSDVYTYWEDFSQKLNSSNSYQRSIGIMLIAENIRWDEQNKFEEIADIYLSNCDDEKFITARQTIQSISKWILYKKSLLPLVINKLISIDISKRKDSQQKLLLLDIIAILSEIHKIQPSSDILEYVFGVTTGGILDSKAIKQVKKLF
nr:hypothetical protein [Clostridium tetanomorphum]